MILYIININTIAFVTITTNMNTRPRAPLNRTRRGPANKSKLVYRKRAPVLLAQQMKVLDAYTIAAIAGTTPTYDSPVNPVQGQSQGQRITDTVYIHRIEWRYEISQVNTDLFSTVRQILFWWRADSSVDIPTGTDILANITNPTMSPYTYHTRQKYHIIKDISHTLVGSATSLTSKSLVRRTVHIPTGKRQVTYNPALTTGTGLLFHMMVSDSLAPPFPIVNLSYRIYYTDP